MREPPHGPNRELRYDPVPKSEAAVGRTLFALLLVLVGLLEFMAAGSKFLIGALRGGLDSWVLSAAFLSTIGLCYFVLAGGVWALRSWVPLFSVLLTLLVLAFGLLRFTQDRVLDLALAMVFMLAMVTNLAILGWAHLPGTRRLLHAGREGGSDNPRDEGHAP